MAKVAILLSTYNGENFLNDQLASIQTQSFTDWQLFIRDDGSTDNTYKILQAWAKKEERICLLPKKGNLGVIQSFFTLLDKAQAPYYMFCDQDDVWLPEKIAKTLAKMEKTEKTATKVLVHTDLKVVDETLQEIHPSLFQLQKMSPEKKAFKDLLIQNNITGCTVMINDALKQKVQIGPDILMHDHWLGLIAAAFGEIAFLPESTMLYRQHGKNTVGATKVGLKSLMKKAQQLEKSKVIIEKGMAQGALFYQLYKADLTPDLKELLVAYSEIPKLTKKEKIQVLKKYHLQKNTLVRNWGFYYLVKEKVGRTKG